MTIETERAFQPTPSQLQRRQRLRRFNQTAVYLPVGIGALIVLALILLLLWRNLVTGDETMRSFTSGVADLVIIIMLLPLMMACATLPLGAVAFTLYRRQKKADQPAEAENAGRLHRILWRIESMVNQLRPKVDRLANRIAQPVISSNARLAYWRAFVKNLINRS